MSWVFKLGEDVSLRALPLVLQLAFKFTGRLLSLDYNIILKINVYNQSLYCYYTHNFSVLLTNAGRLQ
jgi:hypothetical protein